MLSLTRKTEYALIALTHLAGQGGSLVSAREIAGRFHLPLPLLMNILNELTRRGLVNSTRGAKGGYRLSRGADAITLAQVIGAIEGPVRLTVCCTGEAGVAEDDCTLEPLCPVKEPVRKVHSSLEQFLSRVTLAFIASEAVPVNLSVAGHQGPDGLCVSGADV